MKFPSDEDLNIEHEDRRSECTKQQIKKHNFPVESGAPLSNKDCKTPLESGLSEITQLRELDSLSSEPIIVQPVPPPKALYPDKLSPEKLKIYKLIRIIASNHDDAEKTLNLISVIESANLDDKLIESLYHYIRLKI